MSKHSKTFLIILGITIFFYLPIILHPEILLNRDNDLQQQFWPFFYYIKQNFWQFHELPFWNNLIFAGLPLLPDPQFSLFYPPNFIFLILSINTAFIIYFILHTFLGGLGIYFISRKLFNFSHFVCIFTATIYIFSPHLAGYLEAGHSGLVASFGYLPWVLFASLMLARKPNYRWSVILSLSLAGLFFTHTITFLISAVFSIMIFSSTIFFYYKKNILKYFLYFSLGFLLTFGLIAITLLPQFEWSSQTTRYLLLQNKDVYPKWISILEYLRNIFIPWNYGLNSIWSINTEKWLSLGLFSSLLAILGFWHLKSKLKILIILFLIPVLLISLNNIFPSYKLLILFDWYSLMRVSTRVWFIPILLISLLAGFGLEIIIKKKVKKIVIYIIIFLLTGELLAISWIKLMQPLSKVTNYVPIQVYQFLKADQSKFRVFCPEHCFAQQDAAKNNLELIEGYNTLSQTNYYQHMWQLSGGYWNYYTLSIPPQGDFKINKLKPDPLSLGMYNTKYIVTTYPLKDNNLILNRKFDNLFLYQNKLFKPRVYFKTNSDDLDQIPILKFSPNQIIINTTKHLSDQIIISEVYSQGWNAYLDGKEKTNVMETPNSLMLINIKADTKFVDLKYQPKSFEIGKYTSIFTIILMILTLIIFKKYIEKYE